MVIPVKCPACNAYLLNKPIVLDSVWKKHSLWLKECQTKIDHKYVITYDINSNVIIYFLISDRKNKFIFKPSENHILASKDNDKKNKNSIYIPYFEPDFSNLQSLLKKLNTYLIFS